MLAPPPKEPLEPLLQLSGAIAFGQHGRQTRHLQVEHLVGSLRRTR